MFSQMMQRRKKDKSLIQIFKTFDSKLAQIFTPPPRAKYKEMLMQRPYSGVKSTCHRVHKQASLRKSLPKSASKQRSEAQQLWGARCNDLSIQLLQSQRQNFCRSFQDKCSSSAVKLKDSSLGQRSALLLSQMIKENADLLLLDLTNNSIGDQGIRVLSDSLLKFRSLQILKLGNNGITARGFNCLFKSLAVVKTLKQLHLSSPLINHKNRVGSSSQELAFLIQNSALTHVFLQSCLISELSVRSKSLQHLELKNNPLQKIVAELPALLRLGLSSCQVDCWSWLQDCTSLQQLDVSKCGLSEITLTSNPQFKKLKLLNFSSNVLKAFDFSAYAVQQLDLSHCSFTEAALSVQLHKLTLEGNPLNRNMLSNLGQYLKGPLCRLVSLNLGNCQLQDQHIEELVAALKLNVSVESVQLKNNKIMESGGRWLFKLSQHNEQIVRIGLQGNMISSKVLTRIRTNVRLNWARRKELKRKLQMEIGILREIELSLVESERLERQIFRMQRQAQQLQQELDFN